MQAPTTGPELDIVGTTDLTGATGHIDTTTNGNITYTEAGTGAMRVGTIRSTAGAVQLMTPSQDLELLANGLIKADTSSVALAVGKNLTTDASSTVSAGTAASLQAVGNVTAGSNSTISAVTTLLLTAGKNLTVGTKSTISAGTTATLRVGDNVTTAAGSMLTAGTSLAIAVDSPNTDPGVGSVVDINGFLSSLLTTITGQGDNDVIDLNFAHGINTKATAVASLASLATALAEVDGAGGTNSLKVDDSTATTADTGAMDKTVITGLGMGGVGVYYANIQSLEVDLSQGGDTFTVLGTVAKTLIQGGAGSDHLDVGAALSAATSIPAIAGKTPADVVAADKGDLNRIAGLLTFTGNGGSDQVELDADYAYDTYRLGDSDSAGKMGRMRNRGVCSNRPCASQCGRRGCGDGRPWRASGWRRGCGSGTRAGRRRRPWHPTLGWATPYRRTRRRGPLRGKKHERFDLRSTVLILARRSSEGLG